MTRFGKLVGLVGLIATLASVAQAQVPGGQGFFGNIDGRWMWLGGDNIVTSQGGTARTSNGPGGQMLIGYKVDPH